MAVAVQAGTAPVAMPLDYPKILRDSIAAGVITLVLTCLVVGIETISSTGALTFETRYRAVIAAAIGVAIVYFLVRLINAGRVAVPLIGGVILLVLAFVQAMAKSEGWGITNLAVFDSEVVDWAVVVVPVALILRVAWAVSAGARGAEARRREGQFAHFYRRINKQFALVLIVVAVGMPFMPFADRRLVDVATLVLTY